MTTRPPFLSLRVTGRMPPGPAPGRDHDVLFGVDVMTAGGECVGQLACSSYRYEQSADGGGGGLTITLPFDVVLDVQSRGFAKP